MPLKLTPNFTLDEMTKSETAVKHGLSNIPNTQEIARLTMTCLGLEMVRAYLGTRVWPPGVVKIVVHSGFRSEAVNSHPEVKGTPTSGHRLGYCADITCPDLTPLRLAQLLASSSIPFDQLIYEKSRKVVHISFDPRLRRQVKTQSGPAQTEIVDGIRE